MMKYARALVAATKAAQNDSDPAPLQTALDEALANKVEPKCAAAVKARKLLRSLRKKEAAAAAAAKEKAEEERAEAAKAAEEAKRVAEEEAAAAAAGKKKKAKEAAAAAEVCMFFDVVVLGFACDFFDCLLQYLMDPLMHH